MNFYCSFTKSKIQNCPIDDEVAKAKADTVREMRERIRESLPQLLMESSYLDVLNEEHWIPAADQLFNGILEITEEMFENTEGGSANE